MILLVIVVLLVWVPFRRSVTGRAVYAIGSAEGAAYMSGLADRPRQARGLHPGGLLRRLRRALPRASRPPPATPTSRRPAPTRSTRSPRSSSAAPRCSAASARCHRLDLSAPSILRAISFYFRILRRRPAAAAAGRGHRPAGRVSASAPSRILRVKNRSSSSGDAMATLDTLTRPVRPAADTSRSSSRRASSSSSWRSAPPTRWRPRARRRSCRRPISCSSCRSAPSSASSPPA